jgi:hypothetical protein
VLLPCSSTVVTTTIRPIRSRLYPWTLHGDVADDAPTALSARIYFYNRIPITPRWVHRLSMRRGLGFLGLRRAVRREDCSHTTGRWRRLTTARLANVEPARVNAAAPAGRTSA